MKASRVNLKDKQTKIKIIIKTVKWLYAWDFPEITDVGGVGGENYSAKKGTPKPVGEEIKLMRCNRHRLRFQIK